MCGEWPSKSTRPKSTPWAEREAENGSLMSGDSICLNFRSNRDSGTAFRISAQAASTSALILQGLLKHPKVMKPLAAAGGGPTPGA